MSMLKISNIVLSGVTPTVHTVRVQYTVYILKCLEFPKYHKFCCFQICENILSHFEKTDPGEQLLLNPRF